MMSQSDFATLAQGAQVSRRGPLQDGHGQPGDEQGGRKGELEQDLQLNQ